MKDSCNVAKPGVKAFNSVAVNRLYIGNAVELLKCVSKVRAQSTAGTYSLNLDFAVFSQHLLLLNLTYITNLFEGCSSHHAVYGIEQCFFRPWVKLLLLNKSAIFLAKL